MVRALSFTWLVGILAVTGCGRNTDFLTHQKQEISLHHLYQHPLKEMQGSNRLDILFVVDNSPSMGLHQANLTKNADQFIDKFAHSNRLDWRIGLVSTDLKNPPFIGLTAKTLLDRRSPNPVQLFQTAVGDLGLGGDSAERSFAAAIKGLSNHRDFLRPGSTLATIIMTDAVEQSRMTGDEYVQKLQALLPSRNGSVIVYGVLANKDFGCDTRGEEDYDYATSPYKQAIDLTGGKDYKLCEDFGSSLANLGDDLVTRSERPFIQLANRPYLKTIQVHHKGQEIPGGPKDQGGLWFYDYDMNRVVFYDLEFAPDDNETVTIGYDSYVHAAKVQH